MKTIGIFLIVIGAIICAIGLYPVVIFAIGIEDVPIKRQDIGMFLVTMGIVPILLGGFMFHQFTVTPKP